MTHKFNSYCVYKYSGGLDTLILILCILVRPNKQCNSHVICTEHM